MPVFPGFSLLSRLPAESQLQHCQNYQTALELHRHWNFHWKFYWNLQWKFRLKAGCDFIAVHRRDSSNRKFRAGRRWKSHSKTYRMDAASIVVCVTSETRTGKATSSRFSAASDRTLPKSICLPLPPIPKSAGPASSANPIHDRSKATDSHAGGENQFSFGSDCCAGSPSALRIGSELDSTVLNFDLFS